MTVVWPDPASGLRAETLTLPSGLAVHLVTGGPPDGPPVVCIHGWGIHSYLWRRNLGPLIDAGCRVIALDLPGHGASPAPAAPGSFTLEALTRHVRAVLDALGLARTALVAQSMGGRIALELARCHPERVSRVAVFGSVGLGVAPRLVALAPLIPALRTVPSSLVVRRWMVAIGKTFAYGTRGTFTEADVEAYWTALQRPGVLDALRRAAVEFDWRELTSPQLKAITVPVLAVFGTRDWTIRPRGAAALVAQLPHGRLVWITDAGHVVNEEVADEVNPLLVEFICPKP